ncbi:MAG: nucleotidyltransferase family protein, partial [Sulfobacillus sp.]
MDKTASTTKPIAIILAAGLSRRMGRPKSELAWGNGTLVTHVVRLTLEHMGWVTILVRSPFVAPLQGVVDIVNPSPEKGIAESLRLGLEVVLNRHDFLPIAIFLADQPFVQARDTTEV